MVTTTKRMKLWLYATSIDGIAIYHDPNAADADEIAYDGDVLL